ncbi:poly(U)-specific 3'-to-5' RNA exonuclease [Acarospora aff. strigata]|nr:poly(U)-specific 3'-to-5' RNA exonuclease [Acarospora aff. strigata]
MILVEYSDSNSEAEAESRRGPERTGSTGSMKSLPATVPHKRKRDGDDSKQPNQPTPPPPPLPAGFHDLYASGSKTSTADDPSLHGGRQRLTPHVEGNWPTHIYLEWYPKPTESNHLLDLIPTSKTSTGDKPITNSLLESGLGTPLPLHISLSRPVILLTPQRDNFLDLFKKAIERSGVRPFEVSFKALDWVPNHENTRWFLVLRLERPRDDSLNRLLCISNKALGSFRQPPLYATREPEVKASALEDRRRRGSYDIRSLRSEVVPGKERANVISKQDEVDFSSHFHISIGWSLGSPPAVALELARTADLGELQKVSIRFDAVKLKVGNAVTVVQLPTGVEMGKGLIGS